MCAGVGSAYGHTDNQEPVTGGAMSVSSRAAGWLTGAFLAVAGTVTILLAEHPRTADVRALAVGGVLLSSVAGGWSARLIRRGAPDPGPWSVAMPCMVIGAFLGVVTFLFLCAVALLVLAIGLAHSNLAG